jgi:hypothetical protein
LAFGVKSPAVAHTAILNNMDVQPKKPRFQFRLSTWFVLVAILAWAMTHWPWVVTDRYYASQTFVESLSGPQEIERHSLNAALIWPALALPAFVTWKAAWSVAERRRRRLAHATLVERSLH